jgi:germination protein M
MSKRKTKRSTNLIAGTVLLVSALGIGSLAYYVRTEPSAQIPVELRRDNGPAAPAAETPEQSPQQVRDVKVFVPKEEGFELSFDEETVRVPANEKPEAFAVKEFLRRSEAAPAGTRLLSVEVVNRVALLHFNPALTSGMGSFQERAIVEGLERTLGQFRSINGFTIHIEGERLESLGEHFELSNPHPVKR